MFRWKDYSRIWVTQRNKCTSSRLDESELRLTTTMHCVLTFASCKAVFALNASSQHQDLKRVLPFATLPVAFGNDEQKPRTQISWIIVSPKNFWAEYFYVRNIVRLVSTPHCQRLMKQKVLTLCEQSLLNPAPMLHCALFCFVARMKKEFCSNVVIVLFTYRRRRWAAGWVDGWYSEMDPFLQNGLVDVMKKTCNDGWYFGILSLLHFQGHKCLWMYLSLFHFHGRNHRNGWYIDTRIGIDGIVSLLLFGTVGFRTDDILTGWMISELVAFHGCYVQVDDICMRG
jgi:hypothetical protein